MSSPRPRPLGRQSSTPSPLTIDVAQIADIVSVTSGVPVSSLTESESRRLLQTESVLKTRIIGQDEAVEAVAKAVRRSRSPLKDPRRPGGSFIFLGPTGTGKTELAKTLAEYLFGSKDALISFDMSEFGSEFEVSKLIGSPPGYVGHDEGGQLTKAVRRHPYSVVLFDEIEKAHPDIFNILLQVLEEGRLTDSQGKTVDFRNTVIIMTSNVGAREIAQDASVGFGTTGEQGLTSSEIRGRAMGELKRLFRPELLNRIDDIVVFQKLSGENLTKIAHLLVDDLRQRLIANGMNIKLTDAAYNKIVAEGTDLTNGARPLRRAIQKLIEDPLSEELLAGEWGEGDTVLCDVADGKFVFSHGTGEIPHRVRRARSVAIPPRRHRTPATPRRERRRDLGPRRHDASRFRRAVGRNKTLCPRGRSKGAPFSVGKPPSFKVDLIKHINGVCINVDQALRLDEGSNVPSARPV